MRYPGERVVLIIDGSNLQNTLIALDLKVDYQKILTEFSPLTSHYYISLSPIKDNSSKRLMLNHLEHLGFTTVTKMAKIIDRENKITIKGDMDVELAVDMVRKATECDRIVLFSGDSDFCYLVKTVQNLGTKVTVVSSSVTRSPAAATELRRQADEFIELNDLAEQIRKTPRLLLEEKESQS